MKIEAFKDIKNLIVEAQNSGLLTEAENLSGFSGKKLIGALQRLAKNQYEKGAGCYLEVGVFQGLTLISVAKALNGSNAYGIDNYSQFDPDKVNQAIVEQRAQSNSLNNINLINADYEDALNNLEKHIGIQKIGTYFVDGPHDYRSQLICLLFAQPFLSESAVIVIDDCNYRHVRLANRDFLVANPEYKLIFEAYTQCHPGNMDEKSEEEARNGWWNGVNIIVRDKNNVLQPMLPSTIRDRTLYENEHLVHSSRFGALATESCELVESLFSLNLIRALKQLKWIRSKMRKIDQQLIGKYSRMNTFSEQLVEHRHNPAIA